MNPISGSSYLPIQRLPTCLLVAHDTYPEFATYFLVVTWIQSLTVYSYQFTGFKCFSHILYEVTINTILSCKHMYTKMIYQQEISAHLYKYPFSFFTFTEKISKYNCIPSFRIGIRSHPFFRISFASSKVKPSGTFRISLGYTGVIGFHSMRGKRGRDLQLQFLPRKRYMTPPLLNIILPPVFSCSLQI